MKHRLITLSCAMLAILPVKFSLATENNARVAPVCAATTFDAKNYNLSQFKGKVVYVDFWASWCAPCVQSFPFMNGLHRDFSPKGLQVLAINMDEIAADAQNFLTEHPAQFTVLTDANQQCAKGFQVKAMPSSYLIDRNGVIRHEHLGFHKGETAEIQALIKQLLAEPAANH